MAGREITFSCHVIMEDGKTVNFNDLSADEQTVLKRKFGQRMAHSMQEHLQQHPDECARL